MQYEFCRFEIEKKLRQAKKKEQKKKGKVHDINHKTVMQRSKERRKQMEDKKDSKMSALKDLKAKREEKIKKGIYICLL